MSGTNPKVIEYASRRPGKPGRQLELFLVDVTRDDKGNVIALFHGEVATIDASGNSQPDVQATFDEYLQEEAEWAARLATAEDDSDGMDAETPDQW